MTDDTGMRSFCVIDGDYSIIVVALGILNGVPEAGLVAGTGTGQGLDGTRILSIFFS